MVAAILGMGAAAGVLAWVTWRWTERKTGRVTLLVIARRYRRLARVLTARCWAAFCVGDGR